MYQPAIAFDSVGDVFSHNTMYDGPHSGMLGHANDCRFEHNNFSQLCTESGDAGAWYSGRSWADRGNSISHNIFERIRNFGAPIPLQAQNVHCIHFDDQMSGYTVSNNTFKDSWVGIMLGGGRRTAIVNNTFEFIHHAGVEFDNRGQTWQKASCDPAQAKTNKDSFYQQLAADRVDLPPWSTKWPYLQHIKDDRPCVPVHNQISDNRLCEVYGAGSTWITASAANIAKWGSVAAGNVNFSGCTLHRGLLR